MRTIFLITCAAITIAICSCGSRNQKHDSMRTIMGNTVEVSFRSGRSQLPVYFHENETYLLGEEGVNYQICLKNRAPARVEAVVSVDGRDVVSGRNADYRTDRGYVMESGEEICIQGFQESTSSAASFVFTEAEESYASKMGDGSNVGVIGVAVFEEFGEVMPMQRPHIIAGGSYDQSAESPAEEAYGGSGRSSKSLGSGYGDSVSSPVEIVPFTRRNAEQPAELVVVYYDSKKGLEARGIKISKKDRETRNTQPNPFPGAGNNGFAPPPPN